MKSTFKTYQEELVLRNNLKENFSSIRVKAKEIKPVEGVLFLAETLKEEVLRGTKKQQQKNIKKLRKLLLRFSLIALMAGGFGILTVEPHTALAASNLIVTTTDTVTPEITPGTIMEWGLKIALMVVAIGLTLGICLLAVAGIYLMITRRRQETIEWNSDIIKGVTQVLVAIPTIYAIFQLTQFVFKNFNFLKGLM